MSNIMPNAEDPDKQILKIERFKKPLLISDWILCQSMPTYWLTTKQKKISDIIDFGVIKGIAKIYFSIFFFYIILKIITICH